MNLKEVIKTLELAKAEVEWNYPMDYAVAIDEAIKAIEKQKHSQSKFPSRNGLHGSKTTMARSDAPPLIFLLFLHKFL